MNMNDKKIDELIRKALQEELALPEGLSRRLEERIDGWAATEEKKVRPLRTRRQILYWAGGIAASILLCVGFFQYDLSSRTPDCRDTYADPEDAAVAAEKALLLLSHNLNKGIGQINDAGQEFDKVNNILNKHLND